jgi:N-acetylneuraminic acid mutarotase
VPTDAAVSGVWKDSLVYLVSGWHDTDNIDEVQIFDPAGDRWSTATPIPGPPVFGHAGALAANTIVYIDGVRRQPDDRSFVMSGSSWRGDIDPEDPERIVWSQIPDHPGPPLYRAAAGSVGSWIVFSGGTDNPYNYNGIGYDGVPSEPRSQAFAYHVERGIWRELESLPHPTMDHRGIVFIDGSAWIVGGMGPDQEVLSTVTQIEIEALFGSVR